jgi:ABC-type lipoprotein export system ATPase subunit
MSNKYPRGSEWRKWDLHVHSPASEGFKGDWPGFVIQLGNSDCDVIGINDYFSVAGYKEIQRLLNDSQELASGNKAYREALEKLKQKTIFPVVECRMNNIVLGKSGTGSPRINFHIIFSNEVSADDIERFIRNIKVKDQSIGNRYVDKAFLLNDVSANFSDIWKDLNTDTTFRGKYLIWIPYDEYGGIDNIDPKTDKLFKEGLIYGADILGSGNKKQADFFLWKDDRFTEDQYKEWFGKRKPCIKGSDSHSMNDEIGKLKDHKSNPTDKYCWIKADPTFRGFCQIINEPEDRVYIGRTPHKIEWVKDNKTCVLARAQIYKTTNADIEDVWFNCDLSISHDMVAVIGNKGSGKSALADILALAGDTDKYEYFSFLDKKKFREKKLAANFEVIGTWTDDSKSHHNLQEDPEANKPETIKYIPQAYLETICTETSADEGSAFQYELRKVIFSHIDGAGRLGKESLEDLIAYKTEEIQAELAQHKQDLSQINGIIVGLEQKASPDYKAQIGEALKKKKQELDAHNTNKPSEVPKPDNLTTEQKLVFAKVEGDLEAANKSLQSLEEEMRAALDQQKTIAENIAIIVKLEGRLANIENDIAALKRQTENSFSVLGLNIDDTIKLIVDRQPLIRKKELITKQKAEIDESLSNENKDSLISKHAAISTSINILKSQLDAPNKRHQDYLQLLKLWQKRKEEIEGGATLPETLRYYEAQLRYIDEQLPADIEENRLKRKETARRICDCIMAVRQIYAELFSPVQSLIENSVIIKDGFKLSFASAIIQRGFRRDFFDRYISQGVNGSFCGKDPGDQRLEELLENYDFNDPDQAMEFTFEIERHLNTDFRSSKKHAMQVAEQLRKHTNVRELYDFLWSFEYLIPEYSLKLDGKNLTQLSPGERGVLLLVFYLLVDKSSKPIIVDQPEENLDNQTIYHLLIPVIKAVKKRRQIIMVTHNPNIAVVCDAEQIIHASIDRANNNRITYTTGAIEDPTINKLIVNVLEGTRPAFDNRGSKYS